MSRIAVVGSINLDYVVETERFPEAGETVMGKTYFTSPGGKGANQAVAASRLGAEVTMFGSLGVDANGESLKETLKKEKVDIIHLNEENDAPTGIALIELCKGENRILVVPGANTRTNLHYAKRIESKLLDFDVVLFQLEVPIETMEYLVPLLHKKGVKTMINPAPVQALSQELISKTSYLIPNEHEYSQVLQEQDSLEYLVQKHSNQLIVTQGKRGVTYHDGDQAVTIPSIDVDPVDTTGAGDTFCGAFAVGISEGKSIEASIRFGIVAAGLSVTKKGAQSGMPTREEVERYKE